MADNIESHCHQPPRRSARGLAAPFLTAYGKAVELPPSLSHVQVLSKPFSSDMLAANMLTGQAGAIALSTGGVCDGGCCD